MSKYIPPERMTEAQIREEVNREFRRWNELAAGGCRDPHWPDGYNMNLVRNHIIYWYSLLREKMSAILFLWVCFPCLPDALKVIASWGFEYYGLGFDWCKIKADGTPKIGCGYYTRQNNELCLIGVKSGMQNRIKPLVRDIGCSILEPAREHSKKPDCIRDKIVSICGNLSRIELFARDRVPGWDAWGNEV